MSKKGTPFRRSVKVLMAAGAMVGLQAADWWVAHQFSMWVFAVVATACLVAYFFAKGVALGIAQEVREARQRRQRRDILVNALVLHLMRKGQS
jgi:hypothetical protein